MQVIIFLLQDCQFLGQFIVHQRDKTQNPKEAGPYIITERTPLCVCSTVTSRKISFPWRWWCGFAYVLYCEYDSCELFWYVNTRNWRDWWVNKIEFSSESVHLHVQDLVNYEHPFTATDLLLSENPVILTRKDLQAESYDDHEVVIEYNFADLFKN